MLMVFPLLSFSIAWVFLVFFFYSWKNWGAASKATREGQNWNSDTVSPFSKVKSVLDCGVIHGQKVL